MSVGSDDYVSAGLLPPSDDESVNMNSVMPSDWDNEADRSYAFGQDLKSDRFYLIKDSSQSNSSF
jgi:hypothetical protein